MKAVNLLASPRWRAEDLGLPMPDSPHAVSACLPLWEHNVRYEEGDPAVIGRLKAAYPRFCLNPFVSELCRRVFGADRRGLVFPSEGAARRAVAYCQSRGVDSARLVESTVEVWSGGDGPQTTAVAVAECEFSTLKEYWQHAGEVLTSRAAELLLRGERVSVTETSERQIVRQRIADLHQTSADNVFLHVCGMAAISAVWRAIRVHDPISASVQFGFPYVDTLKIQERFEPASHAFFAIGDEAELYQLEEMLKARRVCAIFCEAPTNPLLRCPDLKRLRQLADDYDAVLVVDDTLTACVNERLLPLADVIVTSLTKYFSGYGDVLAGCCVMNPQSRHAARIVANLRTSFEELLPDADVKVLEQNSRDVAARVNVINGNAREIARRLQEHPKIDRVYHPSLDETSLVRGGGLLSIVLHDPSRTTPDFFDALRVCKGPNLGTNFTLCCPYTILAHFTELEFVERCGVSRWLLRISVGTEPVEELWSRFEAALGAT